MAEEIGAGQLLCRASIEGRSPALYRANSAFRTQDPNLYLTVTYKNMAALDGLDDREEPITKKIWSTRDAAAKADVDRESMREILGTQLIRRLDLK